MVFTRADAKVAFDHIINNVLSRYDNTNLKMALVNEGYDDIITLMTIDDNTIEQLVYPDPDDETNSTFKPLRLSDKGNLKLWRAFVVYRNASDNPIGENWLQVTMEEYDAYCISPNNIAQLLGQVGPPPSVV
jgi:hypothetical protein